MEPPAKLHKTELMFNDFELDVLKMEPVGSLCVALRARS